MIGALNQCFRHENIHTRKKVEVEIFDRLVEITGRAPALVRSFRNQSEIVTVED